MSRARGQSANTIGASRPTEQRCDHPGCDEEGLYPAPRSRGDSSSFLWFCLTHVREYNRRWDYFRGMSEDELNAYIREDVVGHRPTWPLGGRGGGRFAHAAARGPADPFNLFGEDDPEAAAEEAAASRVRRGSPEDEALSVFDLSVPVTLDEIKSRYKSLVKQLHPDANGGDKLAEERLKTVNHAYSVLKAMADQKNPLVS